MPRLVILYLTVLEFQRDVSVPWQVHLGKDTLKISISELVPTGYWIANTNFVIQAGS